jgi:hypothetical protein
MAINCHTRTRIKEDPNPRLDASRNDWIGLGDAASFVSMRDLVDDRLKRRFA